MNGGDLSLNDEDFDVDVYIVHENVVLSNVNVVEDFDVEEDFDVDDYIVNENVVLSKYNVVEEDVDVQEAIVNGNVVLSNDDVEDVLNDEHLWEEDIVLDVLVDENEMIKEDIVVDVLVYVNVVEEYNYEDEESVKTFIFDDDTVVEEDSVEIIILDVEDMLQRALIVQKQAAIADIVKAKLMTSNVQQKTTMAKNGNKCKGTKTFRMRGCILGLRAILDNGDQAKMTVGMKGCWTKSLWY
ncbi:hypothetical protein Tco_1500375 [Tanacetum coccineum]